MRQNALLRSGKGLGTPGTARKKAARMSVVAPVPPAERDDHFAVRNGVLSWRDEMVKPRAALDVSQVDATVTGGGCC